MKKGAIILLLLIAACIFLLSCKGGPGAAGPAGGTVAAISYQNGVYPSDAYLLGEDAYVSSTAPNQNNGTCTTLSAGVSGSEARRSFIKFSLIGITPDNVRVKAAYLTLYSVGGAGIVTFTAHAITQLWSSGSACGASGVDASWINRATSYAWTTAGGDYDASPASNQVVFNTATDTQIVLKLSNTVVQSWIDSPGENYGLLIRGTNESTGANGMSMASCENGTLAMRPKLTIYYALP